MARRGLAQGWTAGLIGSGQSDRRQMMAAMVAEIGEAVNGAVNWAAWAPFLLMAVLVVLWIVGVLLVNR